MRTIFVVCVLLLNIVWSLPVDETVAVENVPQETINNEEALLEVDSQQGHENESGRQARLIGIGGIGVGISAGYGYGGYGHGYGGYGHGYGGGYPYYGGYGGYPYHGGYGGYGRYGHHHHSHYGYFG